MDKKIIGGVFSHVENAEAAIKEVKDLGYDSNDISVFAKDKDQVNDITNETGTSVTPDEGSRGKNAGKGAGIGAASGGVLGGIAGLIAEIGLLAIPGIGILAAAGPLATTLSGAGIGASGGGIVGALVGAGVPEEQAKQYEQYLKDGKIIVMVEAETDKEDSIYQAFIANKTENTAMYPRGVIVETNDSSDL